MSGRGQRRGAACGGVGRSGTRSEARGDAHHEGAKQASEARGFKFAAAAAGAGLLLLRRMVRLRRRRALKTSCRKSTSDMARPSTATAPTKAWSGASQLSSQLRLTSMSR